MKWVRHVIDRFAEISSGVQVLNVRSHRHTQISWGSSTELSARNSMCEFSSVFSVRLRSNTPHTPAAMLHFFSLQLGSLLGSGACNDYIRGVWQTVWASRHSLSEGGLRDMNNWCVEVEAERRGLKAERLLQCHPLWRVKVPHMEKWLLCWSVYRSCC